MKYLVEGTMFFESVVDIPNIDKLVKVFSDSEEFFDIAPEALAERVVKCVVVGNRNFVEGVGVNGKDFEIIDKAKWFDTSVVKEVE